MRRTPQPSWILVDVIAATMILILGFLGLLHFTPSLTMLLSIGVLLLGYGGLGGWLWINAVALHIDQRPGLLRRVKREGSITVYQWIALDEEPQASHVAQKGVR